MELAIDVLCNGEDTFVQKAQVLMLLHVSLSCCGFQQTISVFSFCARTDSELSKESSSKTFSSAKGTHVKDKEIAKERKIRIAYTGDP